MLLNEPPNTPNPFTTIEDPFQAVRDNAKQMYLDNPNVFEFDRLAYETFIAHKEGKAFYEMWQEKFLNRSLINPADAQAMQLALYWEGFKDCFRMAYNLALSHQQRILAP